MKRFNLRGFVSSRLPAAAISTAILIALLAVGALTPMSRGDAEAIVNQFDNLLPTLIATPAGIFFNNLAASLLMMIPAAGMALAAFIVYNTGMVIGAYSIVSNTPVALSLLIPFLTIYGFIEMLAYGFAVSQSFFLTSSAVKRTFRKELSILPISIAAVVGLLFIGAVLEWILIVFLQGMLTA
ncbi:MAG: hypothetical protein NZ921_01860 [Candidatus Caldarchaeum sp.]|nr:hypothetical protein [Candidatus Caldarchaeum sp.]MCX8201102.1 hypothetical protein [Candidatus Caldarchaeum sp.]